MERFGVDIWPECDRRAYERPRDRSDLQKPWSFRKHDRSRQHLPFPSGGRNATAESPRRIAELLALVRLDGLADKEVGQLSRGQQQRANLARVLAAEPEILLLHEPLSEVDEELRRELGEQVRRLQRSKGFTVVMSTRNRRDAFLMADRFAVLRGGRIEQIGDPATVYRQPRSAFVATLTGEANLVPGHVGQDGAEDEHVTVSSVLGTMQCHGVGLSRGQPALLLIRPEALKIVQGQPDEAGPSGTVTESRYLGSHSVTKVDVQGQTLTVHTYGQVGSQYPVGARVHLSVRADDCHALVRDATSDEGDTRGDAYGPCHGGEQRHWSSGSTSSRS